MTEKIQFKILKFAGEPKPYNKGSSIFKKGDPGDSLFVVTHGEVDIVADGKVIDHLVDGEMFGEMAMIDKVERSADAIASIDCEIVQIDEARFNYMVKNNPEFAMDVIRMVSTRLRAQMADQG